MCIRDRFWPEGTRSHCGGEVSLDVLFRGAHFVALFGAWCFLPQRLGSGTSALGGLTSDRPFLAKVAGAQWHLPEFWSLHGELGGRTYEKVRGTYRSVARCCGCLCKR